MADSVRKPLVAGNWKMHKRVAEAVDLASGLKTSAASVDGVDIVVCPPFTALEAVGRALAESQVALGAQNAHFEDSGAFTGEVAPGMLLDVGCTWVILGHSERRQLFGEDDALINRKLRAALDAGLRVMFCIGETLEEREGGVMDAVLTRQIAEGLKGMAEKDFERMAVAYEPVWAIGTGVTATPEQAEEAHRYVRELMAGEHGGAVAGALRIQYGGSVKPDNAATLYAQPNVDGFLVGGASLDAAGFTEIVKATR